jgi:hypothetical protein
MSLYRRYYETKASKGLYWGQGDIKRKNINSFGVGLVRGSSGQGWSQYGYVLFLVG